MSRKKTAPDPETLDYETALGELEAIIERIEGGETGLEESLEAYERGVALLKRCRAVLATVEQRVESLAEAPSGSTEAGEGEDDQ